jgi:ABC-type transport system involved in cytochrome c biogenesis permease subunit
MNPNQSRYLPAGIAAGLGLVYLLIVMIPSGDAPDKLQLEEAARIPVVEGGRVMPLDTVARNSLMVISGKQTFVDEKNNRQPAIKWLLDVISTVQLQGPAMEHKVFRIENDQVLGLLDLKPRSGLRYSLKEILPRYNEFDQAFKRAASLPAKSRNLFENKVLELGQHLKLFQDLSEGTMPLAVPPASPGQEWRSLRDVLVHKSRDPAATGFLKVWAGYLDATDPRAEPTESTKAFNTAVANYLKQVEKQYPEETGKTDFEVFFNNFAPFYHCAVLYVFVLILACVSWVAFPQELNRAAFGLACLTLAVHTFALFGRMYLMGRPLVFVTNLYSSAVFIGWISVILGLVLEYLYHNSLGNFVASVTGALTLIIGHYLATTGDTLEMMQAVLDTNFWLATHVTSVTIGYSATFVAGFLGITMIILGVFTRRLDTENYRSLGRMIYGIVCFAMLFSFVGTVLGGIWADQSWGRFWGWDPKENGALLIVLWNALILHARWGGMVQQRGVAVLAVGGNIITSWSWFGVNMLGVGLHSYGFMEGAMWWLLAFAASQLVIIGIGLVPLQHWASFAPAAAPAGPVSAMPSVTTTPSPAAITAAPLPARQGGRKKSKQIKARR